MSNLAIGRDEPLRKTKPVRPCVILGHVALVPLTKGYFAIIDAADVELVKHRNWCATRGGKTIYAKCNPLGRKRGERKDV